MMLLLIILMSVIITGVQVQGSGVKIMSPEGKMNCLTIGSDKATIQLFPCNNPRLDQLWEIIPNGFIQSLSIPNLCIDAVKSHNGDALQVQQCTPGDSDQKWTFDPTTGKIFHASTNKCMAIRPPGAGNDEDLLSMLACDSRLSMIWKSVLASDQVGGVAIVPPPPASLGTAAVPPPPPSSASSISTSATESSITMSEKDHYLCVCIAPNRDDMKCTEAVRAACTVGHIPSKDCFESFDNGNHDAVSNHVIQLIDQGAKCSNNNNNNNNNNNQGGFQVSLPAGASTIPLQLSSEDHYLCICISPSGPNLDEKCEAAVRAACIVGHLPSGSCYASFETGKHAEVSNHILTLIDRGAKCENQLKSVKDTVNSCPEPPCFGAPKDEPTNADHYLCVCLDDHTSIPCSDAMKRACGLGHIPESDCKLAIQANYIASATRHVLHLIDHGARCAEYKGMAFTNNKCHCKQSWKLKTGQEVEFPNNCGEYDGKGFKWCEIYPEEACVGFDGTNTWDRCDNPQQPIRRIGQATGIAGEVSAVDHYLCVCADTKGHDELCNAAVKAACSVGHIAAEICKSYFEEGKNDGISQEVLRIIERGAQCKNIALPSLPSASSNSNVNPPDYCNKGVFNSKTNTCDCYQGYTGRFCTECASSYTGFPNCAKQCSTTCIHGTCDSSSSGLCICPANFVGPQCDQCAPGFSGSMCEASQSVSGSLSNSTVYGAFGMLLMILFYIRKNQMKKSLSSSSKNTKEPINLETVRMTSSTSNERHSKYTGLAV